MRSLNTQYGKTINEKMLEIHPEYNLEPTVKEQTKASKTLDLAVTTNPDLLQNMRYT